MTIPILQPSDGYTIVYDKALEYEEIQQDIGWTAKEIAVEDDLNDLKLKMSDGARHGILHTLKLFTEYELIAGSEWWSGYFCKHFPRAEFQRMGTEFARTELCIHAPFYNKINEVLMINTPEFYNSWKKDPVLSERMAFIGKHVTGSDILLALAVFSMIEGAVLYSSFAFLKSFKKGGQNLIPNIISGINFSVRDENLHSEAGAWVFRTLLKESNLSSAEIEDLTSDIATAVMYISSHESEIINQIFNEGGIEGITSEQLESFVSHRLRICLSNLGMQNHISIGEYPEDTTIQDWFYDDINSVRAVDHFSTISSGYSRNWSESKFEW